jgi:hypothetical protein
LFQAIPDGKHIGKGFHRFGHLHLAPRLVRPLDVITGRFLQSWQNALEIPTDVALVQIKQDAQ